MAAAQELERQKAELQARRQLEFQRQRTKSLEVAAQKRQQEEEVSKLSLINLSMLYNKS